MAVAARALKEARGLGRIPTRFFRVRRVRVRMRASISLKVSRSAPAELPTPNSGFDIHNLGVVIHDRPDLMELLAHRNVQGPKPSYSSAATAQPHDSMLMHAR